MKTTNGLWRLSPSGLYDYDKCKTCFWIENHIGKTFPVFRLNDAMDEKLKNRFDYHRKNNLIPSELSKKLPNVYLFNDIELLRQWRTCYQPLEIIDTDAGYHLRGKIDDVLVKSNKELIPIDFKSSGDPPKADKKKYYVSQINAYGLMFKKKNYKVADKGYVLYYYTSNRQDPKIPMTFDFYLYNIDINLEAFELKLKEIVNLLNKPTPSFNEDCDQCKINSKLIKIAQK